MIPLHDMGESSASDSNHMRRKSTALMVSNCACSSTMSGPRRRRWDTSPAMRDSSNGFKEPSSGGGASMICFTKKLIFVIASENSG